MNCTLRRDCELTSQLLHAARVLLVEDESLIAMDVEQLCRDNGAASIRIIAEHAQLGPALLEGIDAAILDVKLSGNWTVDFARLLLERGIPFIFATGYSDMPALFEEFPGVPVVGKPYAGNEIVEALAAVLAARPAECC